MMNQTPTRVSLMWKANLTVVWQFLWLSAVMLSPIVGLEQGQAAEKAAPKTIKLKVLVLNYDPIIGGKRLHVEMNFNDPRALADGYMADMKSATRGLIDFEIVEWRDLNEIYAREDGGIYKVEDYVRMRRANSGWPAKHLCRTSFNPPPAFRKGETNISPARSNDLSSFNPPPAFRKGETQKHGLKSTHRTRVSIRPPPFGRGKQHELFT